MISHKVEQGTSAWLLLRAGLPTSSEFKKIITPKTGRLSKSAEPYANKLVAEIYMKEPIQNDYISFDMERGKILEAQAADAYEQIIGVKTTVAGFITDDKGMYGCSPDRFVGDIGLVEIKCLKPENHMEILLSQEMPDDYKPQVQGQLLICEDRQFVDIWYYHPRLPAVRIRNYRDDEYLKKMYDALESFWDLLLGKIQILENMGYLDKTPDKKDIFADQTILGAG